MRLVWQRENCLFSEGCTKCICACAKRALSFNGDSLSFCTQCNPKYASCLSACKTGALIANNRGAIVVASNRCDGCGACVRACARGIRLEGGKAAKCDLCAGNAARACVAACPNGALTIEGEGLGVPDVEYAAPTKPAGRKNVRCAPKTREDGTGSMSSPEASVPYPRFVGDGKRLPAIKSCSDFGRTRENGFGSFSFRVLPLPKASVEELEMTECARVLRVNGETAYCCRVPVFNAEEWEAGLRARYFSIREAAGELFSNGGGTYFSREERVRRLNTAIERASRVLEEVAPDMPQSRRREMARLVAVDTAGFGPVELLWQWADGALEEIEVNHPLREIIVHHRKYGRCITNLAFTGERGFRRVINSIVQPLGISLDDAHPSLDAQLPDGSRLHAQVYPLALSGASANIRFLSQDPWTIPKLVELGTLNAEMGALLWMGTEARAQSLVITGPPAAGKTSFLSALLAFIPIGERVISIEEDVNELRLYDSHVDWVPLRGVHEEKKLDATRRGAGVGIARSALDQISNALRMRPDRIILGEMRGAEARRLFSGANLGVPFIATMHSNDRGAAVLKRLHAPPMSVPGESLSSLDLVVSIGFDARRNRRVMELSEVHWKSRGHAVPTENRGNKAGSYTSCSESWSDGREDAVVTRLYSFDAASATHVPRASIDESRTLAEFCRVLGMSLGEGNAEFAARAETLRGIAASGKTGFSCFGEAIRECTQTKRTKGPAHSTAPKMVSIE